MRDTRKRGWAWTASRWLLLALILLLGAGLRCLHLDSECPLHDELITLRYLDAPNLAAFLEGVRPNNGPVPPLYFVLEYGWSRVAGRSELAQRLLSIGLGMASIVVVYLIARRMFGTGAALISTLFLTVNEFHVAHSQNVRMYALVFLLSSLSMHVLLMALERDKAGWWIVHTAINGCLVWVHVLAALVFVPEAILLLLRGRRYWRATRVWAAVHAMLFISVLAWLFVFRPGAAKEGVEWIPLPSILSHPGTPSIEVLLLEWLGISLSVPITPLLAALYSLRFVFAALLAFTLVAGTCALLRQARACETPCGRKERVDRLVFLLAWMIAPPVILFAASYAAYPMFSDRYVFFAFIPVCLLVGGAVASLRSLRARAVAAVVLSFVCLYEALFLLPLPERPDWRGAARRIAASCHLGDAVLVYKEPSAYAVEYYLKKPWLEVRGLPSVDDIASTVEARLNRRRRSWVVLNDRGIEEERMSALFDRHVQEGGWAVDKTEFNSRIPVYVYLISPPARQSSKTNESAESTTLNLGNHRPPVRVLFPRQSVTAGVTAMTPNVHVGAAAPEFSLPDQDGRAVSLADFAGKWRVVYFYPKDDTPGCTTEACEFTTGIAEFEKLDAVVLGISPDSPESHRKFIEKHHLKLTLLSDPAHDVMETYRAWGRKTLYGKESVGVIRSTVLIDPSGKVARHWAKVKAEGHAEQVRKAIEELSR